MIDRNVLFEEISRFNIETDDVNETVDKILQLTPRLGACCYVVTQYQRHDPYEVIEAKITTTRISHKNRKSFSVEGNYARGYHYGATFTSTSIGKTVFFDELSADCACKRLNCDKTSRE